MSYLTTTIVFPFQDKVLNQIDLMLGFDFTDLVAFVDGSPLFLEILKLFYFSSLSHIIFITVLLGILKPRYIMEFCNLYLMCLSATLFVAIFLPAIGPYEYLHIPLSQVNNIGHEIGRFHIKDINLLRNHTQYTIKLSDMNGLISFPSFHTALAILIPYSVRKIKYIFPLLVLSSAIVLIATLPIGGHYLIDIIGGAIITALMILTYNRFSKQKLID